MVSFRFFFEKRKIVKGTILLFRHKIWQLRRNSRTGGFFVVQCKIIKEDFASALYFISDDYLCEWQWTFCFSSFRPSLDNIKISIADSEK